MRVKALARLDDVVPDALPDDLVGVEALRARTPAPDHENLIDRRPALKESP